MSKPLLVATLGPASFEFAQDIVDAGATALRLNGSHMSSEKLSSIVDNVRKQLADVPIVVDLQGAKMRLGKF
ncbi:MAG: pyruvate kinase, partial [Sorangium cellulosum]